jgi:ABC-type transport system substrate-binding protein/DNA-binding SARP family transcriptional activator
MPGSQLKLQLLGPVEATIDGRPVPLGPKKQRGLLALLALHANETVSVDRLVDALWGDRPPASARKMVQLYVSQLRRVLAADSAQIVTQGRGYELRIDPAAVDAASFERHVEEAAGVRAVPNEAARRALTLWQGAPLADVANEPFAAAEIRRLEELRLRAAELAIDDDLALGKGQEALAKLERLIEDHPLRERLYAQRMLALYRTGRQAEALESYSAARQRLVEEAGVEPGNELRDLQARMLRQDPSLEDRGKAPPSKRPLTRPSRPSVRRQASAARLPSLPGLVWAAAAVAIVAAAVFGATRLFGSDHLSDLTENSVGVVDPGDGTITAQYRLGGAPGPIAQGAGSVWVASPADGTVSRLHPEGNRVDTIDVGPSPVGLAFGGGSLWVAGGEDGAIAQVDPAANRVIQRIPVGNGVSAVAVGYGGVWVAAALDGEVARVDLHSGRVTDRIAVGGRPVALATGAGAVWVTSEEAGTVVRIDPAAADAVDSVAVGSGPAAVAVGLGAVWTANRDDGTVSRIDPDASRVTNTAPAGRRPSALAIGGDALWVADEEGALVGLDPNVGQVDARVETGSTPAGLVAYDGGLWVTTIAPPAAHRGGTLRVGGLGTDLDPAVGSYIPDSILVGRLAYESLVGYRRVGGTAGARMVGELATEVPEPLDGGRRYVFQLRSGVRYSDGSPLRASDVRASLERMLILAGGIPPPVVGVNGAERCLRNGASCDLSAGVVANDSAGTVTFNLRAPDLALPEKLQFLLITPAETPREVLRDTAPPGTGPYQLERVVPNREAVLTRNPYFEPSERSGRPPGFADRIELKMGSDEAEQAEAVEQDRLDLATVFAPASGATAGLRTRLGARVQSGAFAMTEYAWLNVSNPPFDDSRVRQALNLAVDRGRIVDLTGGSESGAPTCQLLAPGMPGYRPICPFTVAPSPAGAWTGPDLARARRLVAESGAGGTPVEVWTWPDRATVGRYLADLLTQLGFPSSARVFKDLGESIIAAERPGERPQIGLNGWIADSPDSAAFLDVLVGCTGEFNLASFCDPAIDAAIDSADTGGAEGGPEWQRIERQIADSAPVVPLATRRYVVVTSSRAGNAQFHPFYGVLLDQAWVE